MADILLSVGPDSANINASEFIQAVQAALNKAKDIPKAKVEINLDPKASESLKKQVTGIVNGLDLKKGNEIKIKIGDTGTITAQAKQMGEYKAQVNEAASATENLASKQRTLQSTTTGTVQAGSSFVSNLKAIGMAALQLVSVQQIFMAVKRGLTEAIKSATELDSAMTQLKIVTGATDSEMTRFMGNATNLAKSLGQSVSDVSKSIETFSRLGYSLEDASELTEFATILSNVAAVDTSEATTGLTSVIKGFNLSVTDAEHVADVLVEVGQKYAVSASEIMEAFERSGAALGATGTSFEKSAGLVAAANAAVQNASTVGKCLPNATVMWS